tara:strand:+ start:1142 stop:1462 length:321 start_codon:yes stop_codon:yes gene_type:complete
VVRADPAVADRDHLQHFPLLLREGVRVQDVLARHVLALGQGLAGFVVVDEELGGDELHFLLLDGLEEILAVGVVLRYQYLLLGGGGRGFGFGFGRTGTHRIAGKSK